MKKRIVSLLLALTLSASLAVPAMATNYECWFDNGDTLTVDCIVEKEDLHPFLDGSNYGVEPIRVQMLNPKNLTFTINDGAEDYEVFYGVRQDQSDGSLSRYYQQVGTVKLSELNGDFGNLAKLVDVGMDRVMWLVHQGEIVGFFMTAGTLVGTPDGSAVPQMYTLGNVETVKQGNMTYQVSNAVRTETVPVQVGQSRADKTVIILADSGNNRIITECADAGRTFYVNAGLRWDGKAFTAVDTGDAWTGNVYYTFNPYNAAVDKDMVWAFDGVWVTYETTFKELSAAGAFGGQKTAAPSVQTVNVDGRNVEFNMYALNTGSGLTNYIRVRDLAAILQGTDAQFEVGWNGNVTLTRRTPYTGDTEKAPFHTAMPYADYTAPTYVDGKAVNLEAIKIEHDGGGYTYFKLRDLGEALGFNVGWSAGKGIFVETDKPYDPSN